MKATLLLSDPHWTTLGTRRSRVRERVRARLLPWRLDLALARGMPPDSRGDLSIRAHRLINPSARRRLVSEIFSVLDEAMRPTPARHRVVRLCDVEVLVAAPLLQEIAHKLAAPEPVEAAGVAQIRILLRDGTSPLYSETWTGQLEPALTRALEALRPRHTQPVIA